MPPIVYHMALAREAALLVKSEPLEAQKGSYLLGATSPDSRLLTRASREETHFYYLEKEYQESGADALFRSYPELVRGQGLNPATRAFVAGYLGHLVVDEVWITEIYRPFFGQPSPFFEGPSGKILDRILQYELDCRERQKRELIESLRQALAEPVAEVGVGFLDKETLRRWQEFVFRGLNREPSWNGFLGYAQHFLLETGRIDEGEWQALTSSPATLVEVAFSRVPEDSLVLFRGKAVKSSAQAIKGYLD